MQNEWIEWAGGDCPVPVDVPVDVKFRDPNMVIVAGTLAGQLRWNHTPPALISRDRMDDILAYRRLDGVPPLCWCDGVDPKDCRGCGMDTDSKPTNPKDGIGLTKVPLHLVSGVVKAYQAIAHYLGNVKYGAWNYRACGARASVYVSALHRHVDRWWEGEKYDPVDGTPHLANAQACLNILIEGELDGTLVDDRPPSRDMTALYAELESIMAKIRTRYADRDPRHYTIADTPREKA